MYVCLFVCPRTPPKVLNVASPNLAWVLPQWVTGVIIRLFFNNCLGGGGGGGGGVC